jgi:hypothetical protein
MHHRRPMCSCTLWYDMATGVSRCTWRKTCSATVITLYLVVGRKNDPDLDERQERAMDFESTTMTPVE